MPSTSWSNRESLFNAIKTRLNPIKELTDVRIWNEHLASNENQEWKAPVIFVDFSTDRYFEEYTNNYYKVEQELELKLVVENYTLNKLEVYKLADAVKAYLTGWLPTDILMDKLVMNRESETIPFDNLRSVNIVYNLITYEYSDPYETIYVGGTNSCIELVVNLGMDSNMDGETIRNGTNFSVPLYIYAPACDFNNGTNGTSGNGTNGTNGNMNNIIYYPSDVLDVIDNNELPDWCDTHPYILQDNSIQEIDEDKNWLDEI